MTAPHLQLGYVGEASARQYLESHGFKFEAANVRTKYGEIDLLMREGKELVIIEVKARKSLRNGYPQEAVDAKRIGRLVNAAQSLAGDRAWRIDIVAVLSEKITHLRNVTA